MNIKRIESLVDSKYVDSYPSGHMGSRILRFRRNDDNRMLVVKFAASNDEAALADIKANIHGYAEIREIGGTRLLPSELKEIQVDGGIAIVMHDLGNSMRTENGGFADYDLLWRHFKQAVMETVICDEVDNVKANHPVFVTEVARHIGKFFYGKAPDILKPMLESDWSGKWGNSAIMLLDFTPDNLFADEMKLSFIDPWHQETYLGHPAVSVGQFVTLIQLYRMKDAEEAALILKERCVLELPIILGCDVSTVERALRLGSMLQYILSSYVRRESDPHRAAALLMEAHNLY